MSHSVQIMIVEDNLQLSESLKKFFSKKDGIEVCSSTQNSLDAIEELKNFSPDVIILDIVMPKSDGFALLEYLNTVNSPDKPKVLILSSLSHEDVIKRASDLGAAYYMIKPVMLEDLHERIMTILKTTAPSNPPAPEASFTLEQRIISIFLEIGLYPQNRGFHYLLKAVQMAIEDPARMNHMTKKFYPELGKTFGTNPMNIEKAIRYVIEVAWQSGKLMHLNKIFNCDVLQKNYKPTNSEFISLLSIKFLDNRYSEESFEFFN